MKAFGRFLPLPSRYQRGQRQLYSHMFPHLPSGDLAGRQIKHRRETQPCLAGRDIGNVGQSDMI